jgi:hypothetical protein
MVHARSIYSREQESESLPLTQKLLEIYASCVEEAIIAKMFGLELDTVKEIRGETPNPDKLMRYIVDRVVEAVYFKELGWTPDQVQAIMKKYYR